MSELPYVNPSDVQIPAHLKLVNQNLSLPVDLHYQVTDGLFYFVCDGLAVFIHLLESVKDSKKGILSSSFTWIHFQPQRADDSHFIYIS